MEPTLKLASGHAIPRLGLGVYQTPPGKTTERSVGEALALGYRHVDTARVYGNEADVGRAIAASGLPRESLFVTTKLWNDDQGYESTLREAKRSLELLGTGWIDLYLIHWPVPRRRLESWRALVKLHEDGLCRSIGVSNFTVAHLDELEKHSPVVPHANQVELSPFLQQRDLVARCRDHGIAVEAYSPLTRGERLADSRLVAVAKAARATPAQVLIAWSLARGFVVLPKSTRRARLEENLAAARLELAPALLARLDGLEEGLRTCWDPTDVA